MVRRHYSVLPAVSRSYPDPQGKLPRVTLPFAAVRSINHSEEIKKELLARLACLIHAANVHSEPESNPSIDWLILPKQMYCRTGYHRRKATDIEGSFCTFKIVSFPPATLLRHKPKQSIFRQKQVVPVTIACRPKPKEINNQIVKDHFLSCQGNPET